MERKKRGPTGRPVHLWLRKDEAELLDRLKRHIGTTSDLAAVLDALKHMDDSIKHDRMTQKFGDLTVGED